MSKPRHFARLEQAVQRPLPIAAMRVALLTGQSDLEGSALSPAQRAFLDAIAVPGMAVTSIGFPFDPAEDSRHEMPARWRASLANARQYVWAATNARYRALSAAALQRLIDATRSVLVLVTGSCGLAIASGAASRLTIPDQLRIGILAFG